jgi:hypothetical protein
MYRAIYHSCATLLLCLNALAQTVGQPVRVVPYPTEAPTRFLDYDGSNNLIYVCATNPVASQVSYSLSVTGATLTSIVVLTNVGTATTAAAHGLQIGQNVVVSGSTTGALNATYKVATTPSTTTFTIATAGVADGTYNNGPPDDIGDGAAPDQCDLGDLKAQLLRQQLSGDAVPEWDMRRLLLQVFGSGNPEL